MSKQQCHKFTHSQPEMLNIMIPNIYPKPAFGIYPEWIIISVHILRISGLSKFNISGGGTHRVQKNQRFLSNV